MNYFVRNSVRRYSEPNINCTDNPAPSGSLPPPRSAAPSPDIKLRSYVTRPQVPAKKGETRFKRILALGPGRMSSINTALAAGEQPLAMAQRIQTEWQQSTDVKPATLAKQLARYRAEIVSTLVLPIADEGSGIDRQPPAFDVHDQLCEAVEKNRIRLERLIEKERKTGFPIPAVGDLIKTQCELLGALAKLQFELGMLEYKGPVGRWR